MPITRSAKKALRQNLRRRAQNLSRKEAAKKTAKLYRKLVADNRLEEASKQLSLAYKALDKAAKTDVINKNKASRLKSRLAQLIAKSSRASS
ncbi:MAG: 30S ribosomal protein S20 [Candidatus Liptonbacteria bacterium RIFCSPLOWO2_01_FULL_56_20]|uniref:Small ribosomal subunit protein bS20 n=1 Tax=Candidatus Liptonbacteria bacterium RIFCSPLOWO2_01_FULL_56_20 TaxID=1798652 RepID=A0A1G2CKX8_9BACT|nr:MAG: 30S ribosomal protein S20 [Candidatus Liptonbacteria bacterium RIFCSPLOWO2_01_FULL_56_20]